MLLRSRMFYIIEGMSHRQILLVNSLSDGTQNVINGSNVFEVKNEPILPDFVLWIYVATIVVLGAILNFMVFATLLKSKINGTFVFIIQLILNDIISLGIASIELLYMNNRKWIFYSELCPIYLGLESITSTATVYFIIAINLHAISTHNLAAKAINQKLQIEIDQPSDDENYEVAINTQQRSLTIDYRKRKDRISVMFPILFIWFLAASVSIPMVIFGMLLPNNKSANICGVENFNQGTNILLQLLVLHIRIIIPSLCLMITALYVGYKYLFFKSVGTCRLHENVNAALLLGLALSISYILFSTQRVYGSLMFEIMRKPFMQYKYPIFNRKLTSVLFCMINYAIPAFRPFVYICVDKNVRKKINVCSRACYPNKTIDVT